MVLWTVDANITRMMMKDWKTDGLILRDLKRDEGKRLKPYHCSAGYLTIGFGRNLEAKGITELEAELMLLHDIGDVQKELDDALPWWRELSENRQRVLLNMGFNLGIKKLLGFENTLNYIRNGHYDAAASGMLHSKWAKQVGARAVRLANMMRQG